MKAFWSSFNVKMQSIVKKTKQKEKQKKTAAIVASVLISFVAARLEVASCISSSFSGAFKDNSCLVLSKQKLTGFWILRQTKKLQIGDWQDVQDFSIETFNT